MSWFSLAAPMLERWKWPPDFWRRMGIREFWAWHRQLVRCVREEAEGHKTSPESWDGYEHDPFWAEAKAKRKAGLVG